MLGFRQTFSEATIRRFLLAQLSSTEQSTFETALLFSLPLALRVRLAEIELADDYASNRLKANERSSFRHKFLITADREKKLAVSMALRKTLAAELVSQSTLSLTQVFSWRRLAWRIGFAILALAVLL